MSVCVAILAGNEQHIIGRCIESLEPYAEHLQIVLVNTGSRDDTVKRAHRAARAIGVPIAIYGRRWQNFGANYTELLNLAAGHGEWLLHLHADMTLTGELGDLDAPVDQYLVRIAGPLAYRLPVLVRAGVQWRYVGLTHEYLERVDGEPAVCTDHPTLTIEHHCDGVRRPVKLKEDLRLLNEAAEQDPQNPRTAFYLARTYEDLGEHHLAVEHYRVRAQMDGWVEETFYATFRAGALARDVYWLLKAWEMFAWRMEPLVDACRLLNEAGLHHAAFELLRGHHRPRLPDDGLFVHTDVYEWRLDFELAVAARGAGHETWVRALAAQLGEMDLPDAQARVVAEMAGEAKLGG